MPISTDPAAATGLPTDMVNILPFMRTASADAPDREPPRQVPPARVAVIDDISEVRAMVGLLSLAAESLPAGHSTEFLAVLEPAHARLTTILTQLRDGQQPAGRA